MGEGRVTRGPGGEQNQSQAQWGGYPVQMLEDGELAWGSKAKMASGGHGSRTVGRGEQDRAWAPDPGRGTHTVGQGGRQW